VRPLALVVVLASCTTPNVIVVNNNGVATGGGVQSAVARPIVRGAESGKRQEISYGMSVNPDCTSIGVDIMKVVKAPAHGQITVEQGQEYPNFLPENVRHHCNSEKLAATIAYYTSEPGFVGTDTLTLEKISPSGAYSRFDYVINVR
jgi:hypothetical protein